MSLGIGPRFLHSTGQMHKGGPDDAVHLQVVELPLVDLEIPGQPFTFGTLLRAQAAGDLDALREAGHRAARVDLEELSGGRRRQDRDGCTADPTRPRHPSPRSWSSSGSRC